MYTGHFFKMLLGLLLMAIIGLGFLVATNYFAHRDPIAGITPSVVNGSTSTVSSLNKASVKK